jgi:hypothetical protein
LHDYVAFNTLILDRLIPLHTPKHWEQKYILEGEGKILKKGYGRMASAFNGEQHGRTISSKIRFLGAELLSGDESDTEDDEVAMTCLGGICGVEESDISTTASSSDDEDYELCDEYVVIDVVCND